MQTTVASKKRSNQKNKGTLYPQLIGRLFSPSQKSKKLSHPFLVCFELGMGILNAPRKFFLVVYGPILKLQGLQGVGFQSKIKSKLGVKSIPFLPYEGFK
jgi:hypothetical protein